jgi:hypothetical protein
MTSIDLLTKSCDFEIGDILHQQFQTIMDRILSLHEPFPLYSLSALYYNDEDRDEMQSILAPIESLLRGVSGGDEPVQPLLEYVGVISRARSF